MANSPVIYLVDASVYVFRAWFSMPGHLTDAHDRPVGAAYGYARFLGDLLASVRPEYVAVAFDESLTTSFRNDIYAEYKANRDSPPEELEYQFELCRELTRAFGVSEFASEHYEADDIIGTLVMAMRARGRRAVVVTRDKDLAQLIENGDEYWDFASGRRWDYDQVSERFGVRPEQIADYLALAGDSVDNIPGVRGVGPKTAVALLSAFETLDDLYANLDRVAELDVRGAATLGARLAEHADSAFLSRRLTGIACDAPIEFTEHGLLWRAPDLDRLLALYERLGFGRSLREHAEGVARAHDRG